jgi:hypothetical protein
MDVGARSHRAKLAWTISAIEIALFAVSVVLGYLSRASFAGSAARGPGFPTILSLVAPSLAYPVFGALIASRRPANAIGWLCLAVGGLWFVGTVQITYAAYGVVAHPGALPGAAYVGAFSSWVPQLGVLGTFFLLLFPDGRLPSARWRPVVWISGFATAAMTLVAMLTTRTVVWYAGTHNPILPSARVVSVLDIVAVPVYVLFFVSIVASVVSLFLRYRRASGDEREKLKWIAFAGFLFFVVTVISVVSWAAGTNVPFIVKVGQDLAGLAGAFIPAAALFAVLRYRLYDIDRVISRTLGYAIVSALLAGAYALVALVPTAIIGTNHVPSGLVAGAVLVVAAMFRPLRRRVQNAVDLRFNRARYNATRTVETFAARLRDEIDIDTLGAELTDVVRRTMQPSDVHLWITR